MPNSLLFRVSKGDSRFIDDGKVFETCNRPNVNRFSVEVQGFPQRVDADTYDEDSVFLARKPIGFFQGCVVDLFNQREVTSLQQWSSHTEHAVNVLVDKFPNRTAFIIDASRLRKTNDMGTVEMLRSLKPMFNDILKKDFGRDGDAVIWWYLCESESTLISEHLHELPYKESVLLQEPSSIIIA